MKLVLRQHQSILKQIKGTREARPLDLFILMALAVDN